MSEIFQTSGYKFVSKTVQGSLTTNLIYSPLEEFKRGRQLEISSLILPKRVSSPSPRIKLSIVKYMRTSGAKTWIFSSVSQVRNLSSLIRAHLKMKSPCLEPEIAPKICCFGLLFLSVSHTPKNAQKIAATIVFRGIL